MSLNKPSVILFLLLWSPSIPLVSSEVVSTAIAVSSAIVASGFFAGYDYIKCRLYECCNNDWIIANFTGLRHSLRTRLYGQHLVIDTVVRAIKSHMENKEPTKALVLSFHGWTGGGKNYVSNIIAENIYKKGIKSSYVHSFYGELNFLHAEKITEYKEQLQNWIRGNVTKCASSLFIFDEIDKMQPGIMDALKPFLDYHKELHGVDYRKSIFIFLSNTGGNDITARTLLHWQKAKERESIELTEMEQIILKSAYNEDGGVCGLRFSGLISHHLIDHFVPFLPLERQHVKMCIKDALAAKKEEATQDRVEQIANMLLYFPSDVKIYSSSGCKRVEQKVDQLLEKEYEEDGWHSEL